MQMKLGVVRALALVGVLGAVGCGVDEGCPVGLVRDPGMRTCVLPAAPPPAPAGETGVAGEGGAGGIGGEGGAGGATNPEMPVTITGIMLDGVGSPIVGMSVSLTAPGTQTSAATVFTTPDGSFSMTTVINGSGANLFLKLDGSSALGGQTFPVINRQVAVIGGQMTQMAPIFMPALNTGIDLSSQPGLTLETGMGGGLSVGAPEGLVVSFPPVGDPSVVGVAPPGGFPGDVADNDQIVVTFPVGATMSFPPGADPSMSLTGIPTDRTPFDLSVMSAPSEIIALEPAGADVSGGSVQVTLPNRQNLPPGTELDLFKVDPDSGQVARTDGAQAGEHDAKVVVICNDPTDDPDPASGPPCPASGTRLETFTKVALPGASGPVLQATRPMTRIRIRRPIRRLGTLALQCPLTEVTGRATLVDGAPIAFGRVRFQQRDDDGLLHLLPVSTTTGGDGSFSLMLPACPDSQLRVVVESIVDTTNPKAPIAALAALPLGETTMKVSDIRNVNVVGDRYYLVNLEVRLSGNDGAATTPLRATPCIGTRPNQCTATARHPLSAGRDAKFQYTRLDGQVLSAPNGSLAIARFERLPVPVATGGGGGPGPGASNKRAGYSLSDVQIVTDAAALARGAAAINPIFFSGSDVTAPVEGPNARQGATGWCRAAGYSTNASNPQLVPDGNAYRLINGFGDHTSIVHQGPNTTFTADHSFLSLPGSSTALLTLDLDGPSDTAGNCFVNIDSCVFNGSAGPFGSVFINVDQHIQCGLLATPFVPAPSNSTQPNDGDSQPPAAPPAGPCAPGETVRHLSQVVSVPVGRPPEGFLPLSTPRFPIPGNPPGMTPPDPPITPGQRPPTTVSSIFADQRGKLLDRYIFRVNDATGIFRVWRIDCNTGTRACNEVVIGTGTSPGFVRDVTFFGTAPNGLGILTNNGNAYVATLTGAAYNVIATLPLAAGLANAERIVSGDFEGDGFQDVAVGVNTAAVIGVFSGTAVATTFNASTQTLSGNVLGLQGAPVVWNAGPTSAGMIVAVIPGVNPAQGPRVVTLSGGGLPQRTVQLVSGLASGASLMDTRDFNADGFTDVVVLANTGTGAAGDFAFGSGGGNIFNPGRSFRGVSSSALRLGISSLTRRLAAPFDDRDTDTDVVSGVAGGAELLEQVALGLEDNGFVPFGFRIHQLGIADYDGDGLLDIGGVTDRLLGAQPEGLTHWVAHIGRPGVSLATTPTADPRPMLNGVTPRPAKPGSTVTLGGAQLSPVSRLALVDSRGNVTELAAASAAASKVTFVVPGSAAPGRYAVVLVTSGGTAFTRLRIQAP